MLAATVNQMGSGLSSNQFLFDDTLVVLVLAILMLRTGPSRRLGTTRPPDSLFSPIIIASLAGQILLCIGFFALNMVSLSDEPWFCSAHDAKKGVDKQTWLPLNSSAPQNITYPCYP